MSTWPIKVVGVFCLCVAFYAHADTLEVRANAKLYAEPDRHSEVVKGIELEPDAGPYLLQLVDDKRTNGYYHVKLRGKNETAWIYRTYVRRFDSQHPKQTSYKRASYRHWIDENRDCRDTRAEVLIRDARGHKVEFDAKGCKVEAGTWDDPYTGAVFKDASDLDVDHLVPLKNAHESGAWAWSPERKRDYANFLGSRQHLLAVSASENRKKGDKGPDRYMPPNPRYQCAYVRAWVEVKRDWDLEMPPEESQAVDAIARSCR